MRREPNNDAPQSIDAQHRPGNHAHPGSDNSGPETAAFLAAIVASSNDAIVSKDLNGIITSWNKGAEHIFQYESSETIGRPITIIIPPDHVQEEAYILDRIRHGERVEHFETVRRKKDGSPVDVSLTISPIRDSSGKIIGASKIARDITDQRRAQEQLRQSEERFRVTLASIGDAVIATDHEGRITFMNPVAETLTGWTANEADGETLDDVFKIINEITRQPVKNPVTRVIEKGAVVGLGNHTILIARDGHERPIDDSAAPIRSRDGAIVGVVLVFRDATKQRTADTTARRLTAFIEGSDDAIYSTDLNGMITDWNPAAEHIFGYGKAEIIGRPLSILVPPGCDSEEFQIISRIRRGERTEHYETVRQRKDGSKVDISLTVSPLKESPSGRLIGISKIARDITGRKKIEQALAQANRELEDYARNLESVVNERTAKLQQTIADLEAFSFTISHDLRSPLRSMEGFAHALMSDYAGKLDAQARDYLERISSSAVRMDQLILEVLTYSRAGRAELQIVPIDLNKAIGEVLQTYPAVRNADAEISVERPLLPVLASHASLVQSISNLLTNAVKFVHPGEKAKIRIWTEKSDSHVRLLVRDNGIGIPENLKSKIFEPFQRGHPRAGYEGTGMGLAIVRKAMERMNGRVGVDSREGHGSTFWLELPSAPDGSSQMKQ